MNNPKPNTDPDELESLINRVQTICKEQGLLNEPVNRQFASILILKAAKECYAKTGKYLTKDLKTELATKFNYAEKSIENFVYSKQP